MRRAALIRSITGVLGDQVAVRDAAYMWTRHKWMVPYSSAVFGAVVLLAPIAGIEDWPTRIVFGLAGGAVAVMATTEYWVVAQTDDGFATLEASKIRQVARRLHSHLPRDVELAPVGGTILAADWQVGERRYTVPRSSEQAMQRMAATRSADS